MDIHINYIKKDKVDDLVFKKMAFFFNAIENGWTIKKTSDEKYIFTKNHEGKKEVFMDSFLTEFIKSNMDFNTLIQ